RTGEVMRWGLVPSWAKDPSVGYRMINARAETVGEKPSFRQALLKRRCLVPADGFFEWRGAGKMRVPLRFTLKSGELFAFAGLWEGWRQPDGEWLHTCTIITTAPNDLVTRIHDRMPVILRRDAEDVWLDPKMIDVALLRGMLVPYPTAEMEARQVSTLVNSPQNDSPECIEPVLAA
ncbi:MAG: SOS response-associated peptidase, partial [Chloroflexota bacterium]